MEPHSWLALGSVFLFGLRHGLDHDHLAALTDIAASNDSARSRMLQGTTYALGHAVMLALLGLIAIAFGSYIPDAVDEIAGKVIGVTLIALAVYVVISLVRNRKHEDYHVPSRAGLLLKLFGKKLDERSAFTIGMIHGIGAETPTQVGLFLFAAGVGGTSLALLGMLVFVLGLFITNTIVCAASIGVFSSSVRRPMFYRGLAAITATYSLVLGITYLFGIE
jgi:high-affinity nickel-transport protein